MNVIDSKDANIELVCVWDYIEEKAEDQEVADYARSKRNAIRPRIKRPCRDV